jgi:hypothetical protein
MGIVLPASAGLVDLLSLFFFVIDVKSKSMDCQVHADFCRHAPGGLHHTAGHWWVTQ